MPARAALFAVLAVLSLSLTAAPSAPATSAPATGDGALARTAAATAPRADLTGTIVYIHDHDVWIATPDGKSRRRLTSNGTAKRPFSWPSEDDHGHIVAIRGNGFVVLDQFGKVLHHYAQPLANTGVVVFASVSPSGRRIGFDLYTTSRICDPVYCAQEHLNEFFYASTASGTLLAGATSSPYVVSGSWASNSRTVLDSEVSYVSYQDVGKNPKRWYLDCDYSNDVCPDSGEAEYWHAFPAVSRKGDRYASIVFDQGVSSPTRNMTFLNVTDTARFATGKPPAAPSTRCYLRGLDGSVQGGGVQPGLVELTMQTPTWSPTGRSLAFSVRDASGAWQVVRADIGPDLLRNCDPNGWGGDTILAGGSMPRWSPAPLAPVRHKTRTALAASERSLRAHHKLTLRATVSPVKATGWVRIYDGKHALAKVRVKRGVAVWSTAGLRAGVHGLHARYLGAKAYLPSSSAKLAVIVRR